MIQCATIACTQAQESLVWGCGPHQRHQDPLGELKMVSRTIEEVKLIDLEGEDDEELRDDFKVLACWVSDGATLSKTWCLEH